MLFAHYAKTRANFGDLPSLVLGGGFSSALGSADGGSLTAVRFNAGLSHDEQVQSLATPRPVLQVSYLRYTTDSCTLSPQAHGIHMSC